MIKYALLCDNGHAFDSWFRDSAAYAALETAGAMHCPECSSVKIRKALMTPSVVTARASPRGVEVTAQSQTNATTPEGPSHATAQPIALVDERERTLRDMMRALRREIVAKSDNVGRAFADEARRIHEGETPPRSIYGEATREQVASLLDDGISLLPMPILPDDHN